MLRTRLFSLAMAVAVTGMLVASSGCGKSRATAAQSPPPQTLSEPVRPAEATSAPAQAPAIPAPAGNDEYAVQKTGQSRELPMFIEPPASSAPKPVAVSNTKSGDGKYHTIAKGETLYALSRKYNVKARDLIAANNFKDPNQLSIGTKVYIPN